LAGLLPGSEAATIHPHPTLSEPIHEATLDAIGMALHKG
jgi:hypothetical protein